MLAFLHVKRTQYASARRVQAGERVEPLYYIRTSGWHAGRARRGPWRAGRTYPAPSAHVPTGTATWDREEGSVSRNPTWLGKVEFDESNLNPPTSSKARAKGARAGVKRVIA